MRDEWHWLQIVKTILLSYFGQSRDCPVASRMWLTAHRLLCCFSDVSQCSIAKKLCYKVRLFYCSLIFVLEVPPSGNEIG